MHVRLYSNSITTRTCTDIAIKNASTAAGEGRLTDDVERSAGDGLAAAVGGATRVDGAVRLRQSPNLQRAATVHLRQQVLLRRSAQQLIVAVPRHVRRRRTRHVTFHHVLRAFRYVARLELLGERRRYDALVRLCWMTQLILSQ